MSSSKRLSGMLETLFLAALFYGILILIGPTDSNDFDVGN